MVSFTVDLWLRKYVLTLDAFKEASVCNIPFAKVIPMVTHKLTRFYVEAHNARLEDIETQCPTGVLYGQIMTQAKSPRI